MFIRTRTIYRLVVSNFALECNVREGVNRVHRLILFYSAAAFPLLPRIICYSSIQNQPEQVAMQQVGYCPFRSIATFFALSTRFTQGDARAKTLNYLWTHREDIMCSDAVVYHRTVRDERSSCKRRKLDSWVTELILNLLSRNALLVESSTLRDDTRISCDVGRCCVQSC